MHDSSEDLLVSLGKGDPQAIAALYQREGARMVAFAARYVPDRTTAEDVVVSLLGRWLERPPRIDSAGRMSSFLATSVYHAAIDWIRRERAQQGQPPRSGGFQARADRRHTGPLPELGISGERGVMRRRLLGAMEQMSPDERTLLESHYGHALTAEECMANLGISRAAFHQRLHRARAHLARLLAQPEAET